MNPVRVILIGFRMRNGISNGIHQIHFSILPQKAVAVFRTVFPVIFLLFLRLKDIVRALILSDLTNPYFLLYYQYRHFEATQPFDFAD